jgi:predicted Zn finger-like uncharacterized protein
MRLICPNCDAEYEVDDSAIPLTGRDVQCSNCGHGWFQPHPDAPEPAPEPASAPAAAALPGEDPAPAGGDLPTPPAAALPDDLPLPSSRLDAAALAMLKEEAARELAARRAMVPAPIEVQGDLGLPAPPTTAPVLAAPPPFPAADTPAAVAPGAEETHPASRRSRLPDIEEINSTLRPQGFPPGYDASPAADDVTGVAPDAGSFRAGFLVVIALAVILTLLYAFAPQLAQAVPALEGPLATYVQTADALRLWLDGALRGLIDSLRALAEPAA